MTTKLTNMDHETVTPSNLAAFGPMPEDAIGLKFADEVSDGKWITDRDEFRQLRCDGASLLHVVEVTA